MFIPKNISKNSTVNLNNIFPPNIICLNYINFLWKIILHLFDSQTWKYFFNLQNNFVNYAIDVLKYCDGNYQFMLMQNETPHDFIRSESE